MRERHLAVRSGRAFRDSVQKRDSAPGWGRRRFCQTHDARILYNLCGNGGCMNSTTETSNEKTKTSVKTTTKGTKTRREQPKKAAAKQSEPAQRKRPAGGHHSRRRQSAQNAGEPAIPVKIYPLGGLGEVGKNITLYECQGDMLLVDCGLVFPDSDMYGIDLVIPDFTFVLQNKDRI